jgi:pimeloyl-ACP methyl ester carboxylesterase
MNWAIGIVAAVAIISAIPFLWGFLREKPMTDKERRAGAPGQSVKLSVGVIHCVDRGSPNGPVVVLIHGFSTPMFVFEQNADALEAAGFRIILFDHFGRGWSDRPRATYNAEFYDRELLELLDALELTGPVGIVGYSMGGIIATEFASRHPERVSRLFLITPAGLALNLFAEGFVARVVDLPFIGQWIWRVCGRTVLAGDPQFDNTGLEPARRMQGNVAEQMNYRGYLPAILSTWRNLPMSDCDDTFGKAAATGVPMMAVFGGNDPTIGAASADRLKKVAPNARIEIIEQGTHGLNYELFDILDPWLIDFFRSG